MHAHALLALPLPRHSIHWAHSFFLCVIRRHFLACEDIAGGSELSAAVTFFSRNTEAVSVGPRCQVEEIIILRVIRRHFLACSRGPSCQPLHVQSTSDACRSLIRPRREHQGGGQRRGLGRERHGAREDSAVVSHAEEYEDLLVRLSSPENNSRCG